MLLLDILANIISIELKVILDFCLEGYVLSSEYCNQWVSDGYQ